MINWRRVFDSLITPFFVPPATNYTPSPELITTLYLHEGIDKFAYQDSLGYWTIGVGRCIDRRCGDGLSKDEINYLLQSDLKPCYEQLSTEDYYRNQSQVRKEVLVELVFNMGLPHLITFNNFLDAMRANNYEDAVKALKQSLWAQQVHADRVDNICFRLIHDQYP